MVLLTKLNVLNGQRNDARTHFACDAPAPDRQLPSRALGRERPLCDLPTNAIDARRAPSRAAQSWNPTTQRFAARRSRQLPSLAQPAQDYFPSGVRKVCLRAWLTTTASPALPSTCI